jgi:hypothetical protein
MDSIISNVHLCKIINEYIEYDHYVYKNELKQKTKEILYLMNCWRFYEKRFIKYDLDKRSVYYYNFYDVGDTVDGEVRYKCEQNEWNIYCK